MKPLAFIDIETTGLHPEQGHEIIEIAILKGKKVLHLKIHPQNIEHADPVALQINGFVAEDWADSVHPSVAAQLTASFLHGCMVVGHNVKFDMMFLADLWDSHDIGCAVDRRYIDTVVLSHEHLQRLGLYSLSMDSIRKFFGWGTADAHSALADVEDVRRLYNKLCRCTVVHRFWWWFRYRALHWLGLQKKR